MKNYKQLPLSGNKNDFSASISQLQEYSDLVKALSSFYRKNKDINPRQLHYIITMKSVDLHLDNLIDWNK